MCRRTSWYCAVLGLVVLAGATWGEDQPAQKSPGQAADVRPREGKVPAKKAATAGRQPRVGAAAVEDALKAETTAEFVQSPLSDVVDYLQDFHAIAIKLDLKGMEDTGVAKDQAVTANLKGLPLQSALNLMLRPLKLTWTIDNDVLLITTPDAAAEMPNLKVYDVADLVVYRDSKGELWEDDDTLIDMITSTVIPSVWDCVGGSASIRGGTMGAAKVLVVSAPYQTQRQVGELLKEIRAMAEKRGGGKEPARRDRPSGPQPIGGGIVSGPPAKSPKPQ